MRDLLTHYPSPVPLAIVVVSLARYEIAVAALEIIRPAFFLGPQLLVVRERVVDQLRLIRVDEFFAAEDALHRHVSFFDLVCATCGTCVGFLGCLQRWWASAL